MAIIAKEETSNNLEKTEKTNFLLFDVSDDSRQPINPLNTQQPTVANAMFTSDGNLATLSNNGQLSLWHMSAKSLREKVCQLVWDYLQTNPGSNHSIKELCNGVNKSATDNFSTGENLLIPSNLTTDKLPGIQAIAAGDFTTAIKSLEDSLKSNPNDPEARIYLNNARIGNQKSYTIAVSVPISSDVNGSLEILRGVAQAQDEFNRQQDIMPIRVLIADDRNDPKFAQEIAKELAKNPDVLGVVGHFSSGVTREAAKVYNRERLVAISPVSTSVQLSDLLGKYVFRTVPSDRVAAQKLVDYNLKYLNKQKAVLFYNSKSEYSCSLASEFITAFSGGGEQLNRDCSQYQIGSVVSQVQGKVLKQVNLSDPKFDATESLQGVDDNTVLVLLGDNSKLDQTFEILKANQGKLPILAGDDIYGSKILEFLEREKIPNSENMVVAIPWHIENNRQLGLATKSKELWGDRDINWRTVTAYDAAKALMEAIKQNPNREEIANILRTDSFTAEGATETVQFSSGDRNGEVETMELVKIVKADSQSRSGYDYEFKPVPIPNQTNSEPETEPEVYTWFWSFF